MRYTVTEESGNSCLSHPSHPALFPGLLTPGQREYGTLTSFRFPDSAGHFASGRAEPTILFTNIWLLEPNVREKEKRSTMLPQAKTAFILSNVQFEYPPRHFCK